MTNVQCDCPLLVNGCKFIMLQFNWRWCHSFRGEKNHNCSDLMGRLYKLASWTIYWLIHTHTHRHPLLKHVSPKNPKIRYSRVLRIRKYQTKIISYVFRCTSLVYFVYSCHVHSCVEQGTAVCGGQVWGTSGPNHTHHGRCSVRGKNPQQVSGICSDGSSPQGDGEVQQVDKGFTVPCSVRVGVSPPGDTTSSSLTSPCAWTPQRHVPPTHTHPSASGLWGRGGVEGKVSDVLGGDELIISVTVIPVTLSLRELVTWRQNEKHSRYLSPCTWAQHGKKDSCARSWKIPHCQWIRCISTITWMSGHHSTNNTWCDDIHKESYRIKKMML